MFDILFNHYLNDLESKKLETDIYKEFLNKMNTDYIEKTENYMKVVDYIAGMTDKYFNNQFNSLMIPKSFGYELAPKSEIISIPD